MPNQILNHKSKNNRKYDLIERTAKIGENIIEFSQSLSSTPINNPLISQIERSGTSIGANYTEADCANSRKDFFYKIGLCKKEAKETMHWLRMFAKANPTKKTTAEKFIKKLMSLS